MPKKLFKPILFCIVGIIILVLIFILIIQITNMPFPKYFYNGSIYAPNNNGSFGIDIKNLKENSSFYKNKKLDTFNYLIKIYPTAQESLNSMNDLQLASFYNSLMIYYTNRSNFPYQPQGNFYSIQNNILQRNIWYPKNSNNLINIPDWKYPFNWFKSGTPNWIEVSLIELNTQSPGFWYKVAVGSGLFLKVGNQSLIVKNKIDALYQIIDKFNKINKNVLYNLFETTDVYDILFNYLGYCGKGVNLNYINEKNICVWSNNITSFYEETIKLQKKLNISDGETPTILGIQKAINYAMYSIEEIPKSIQENVYNLMKYGNTEILDEIIFSLGSLLNYDTVQFLMNLQKDDRFVYQILDLRLSKKYNDMRKYSFRNFDYFMDNLQSIPTYKPEFIQDMIDNYKKTNNLCYRDPLDLYNENKVQKIDKLIN
jgi:hypothetical protein